VRRARRTGLEYPVISADRAELAPREREGPHGTAALPSHVVAKGGNAARETEAAEGEDRHAGFESKSEIGSPWRRSLSRATKW